MQAASDGQAGEPRRQEEIFEFEFADDWERRPDAANVSMDVAMDVGMDIPDAGELSERQEQQQEQQQEQRASEEQYRDWLVSTFKEQFDAFEADGGMPLVMFQAMMEAENGLGRRRKLAELFGRLDRDGNSRVSWREFYSGLTYRRKCEVRAGAKALNRVVKKLAPAAKRKLTDARRAAAEDGEPIPEESYLEAYNCRPPPLFVPCFFAAAWIAFAIYAAELGRGPAWNRVTWDGGLPYYSPLAYCPSLRHQAWRFVSYMLLHNGLQHIVFNTVLGCLLGLPLETVHKAWRVAPVFLLGGLAGSLASSVADPRTPLVGASGGVYSLIGAHYALVLMNWEEVQKDWLKCRSNPLNFLLSGAMRLLYLTLFVAFDFGLAAYRRYGTATLVHVSAAAHLGGLAAGLLVGTPVLRNIDKKPWEGRLAIAAMLVAAALVLFAVLWNIFYSGFPPQEGKIAVEHIELNWESLNLTAVKKCH